MTGIAARVHRHMRARPKGRVAAGAVVDAQEGRLGARDLAETVEPSLLHFELPVSNRKSARSRLHQHRSLLPNTRSQQFSSSTSSSQHQSGRFLAFS